MLPSCVSVASFSSAISVFASSQPDQMSIHQRCQCSSRTFSASTTTPSRLDLGEHKEDHRGGARRGHLLRFVPSRGEGAYAPRACLRSPFTTAFHASVLPSLALFLPPFRIPLRRSDRRRRRCRHTSALLHPSRALLHPSPRPCFRTRAPPFSIRARLGPPSPAITFLCVDSIAERALGAWMYPLARR